MRSAPLQLALLVALSGCVGAPAGSPGGDPGAGRSDGLASTEPAEEAVKAALAGTEWSADADSPVLREADADLVLMRLAAGRPGDAQVVRVRATMALRHHPTPEVYRFLTAAIASESSPDVVAASLDTLGAAFERTRPRDVRAVADAHLEDADPAVRRAARETSARARLSGWTSR